MSSGTRNASPVWSALGGLAAVVVVLLAVNALLGDPDRQDRDLQPDELSNPDNRVVVLQVVAGQFTDDGFRGSERELTITYWIDGERHAGDPAVREGGVWTEILTLPLGTHVRLLVEQHGEGGFLQCTISANGKILLPGGYEHRNDAGDCDVEGVVSD